MIQLALQRANFSVRRIKFVLNAKALPDGFFAFKTETSCVLLKFRRACICLLQLVLGCFNTPLRLEHFIADENSTSDSDCSHDQGPHWVDPEFHRHFDLLKSGCPNRRCTPDLNQRYPT